MYQKLELFYEPREILKELSEPYAEMSRNDHGFLGGLLKKYNPTKAVEIGIAVVAQPL